MMMSHPTQKPYEKPQANRLKPGIYLVATPIGNLRDISFRALDVLSGADLVVCEDTRVTGKLLQAYRIKKQMLSYNDHNADRQREQVLQAVQEGQSVALVSDAGMPLVSDPGYKLIRDALEQEIYVTSVPGANALLTGLQLSGLPSDAFSFLGFLPSKTTARRQTLEKWKDTPGTLICYETAPRLQDSLNDIREVLGNRQVCVARELTKMFEEIKRGSCSDLISFYNQSGDPKGEVVLIIEQAREEAVSQESIEQQLKKALKEMSVRDAAEVVAKASGKPKKTIYTLALKLSSGSS